MAHPPNGRDLAALVEIMAQLRDPATGCPWDIAQSFSTIAPYTIEEAYEVADACARDDMAGLCDELGDLLLQVVFHARMAEERGAFALGDVTAAICAKMIRRHPHVYGDASSDANSDTGTEADRAAGPVGWEAIKAAERAADPDRSALAGVAMALPALQRAEKLQKRAARTGFDWPDAEGSLAKVHEEIDEVRTAGTKEELVEEVGDLLFAVVNWARHLGVDPEDALRGANAKFDGRFRGMEVLAGDGFVALSLDEKDALWDRVKRAAKLS